MAPANKANYKSYEAQARMVRAIVAAHPDVKWNYKEIVACYGSDMTEHALNHRFRIMRAHSIIIREGRNQGFDMKDLEPDDKQLPRTQETVDKKNIAKYFGQSTADGIQFQFRAIKKDAETLRRVSNSGGDIANCLSLGTGTSLPATPSKPTPMRPATSRPATTGKRNRTKVIKTNSSEEDDDLDEIEDYSELEATPSKRARNVNPTRGRKAGTPSRLATIKAEIGIANASAMLQANESASEVETPTTSMPSSMQSAPTSLFGNVDRKPSITEPVSFDDDLGFGGDSYFSHSYDFDASFMGGDAEI